MRKIIPTSTAGPGAALLSKLTTSTISTISTAGKPPTPASPATVSRAQPVTRREPVQDPDQLAQRAALIATAQAHAKLIASINAAPPLQLFNGANLPRAL